MLLDKYTYKEMANVKYANNIMKNTSNIWRRTMQSNLPANLQNLVKLFRVCEWFDNARWNQQVPCSSPSSSLVHYSYNTMPDDVFSQQQLNKLKLKPSEKILIHWLTYITDYQMRYTLVWAGGFKVFTCLVKCYTSQRSTPAAEILAAHFDQSKKHFTTCQNFGGIIGHTTFTSRQPQINRRKIEQTLNVLDHYDRDIVKFIVDTFLAFHQPHATNPQNCDCLRKVACALWLLTYTANNTTQNWPRILASFTNNPAGFINSPQFDYVYSKMFDPLHDKKRLWCCVRDYKKGDDCEYHQIFKDAILNLYPGQLQQIINWWDQLPLDQLELPGDVWNEKFRGMFTGFLQQKHRCSRAPCVVRFSYSVISSQMGSQSFYPEQVDVSFDFAQRMCGEKKNKDKKCDVCPFRVGGLKLCKRVALPLPSDPSKCTPSMYCNIAWECCGYYYVCTNGGGNCFMRSFDGGLCDGTQNVSEGLDRENMKVLSDKSHCGGE
ncbi:MAG: hypothetical protein N3F63_02355 [Thermoplasmata archaeon]|nr:hypothetical protein [Thermoplasmata archaeon]